VIVIWITAVAVAVMLLLSSYFFRPAIFWQAVVHARWVDIEPKAFAMPAAYLQTLQMLGAGSPALLIALPATLITYFAWKRARYFGNTAPLAISAMFLLLAIAAPDFPGDGFRLVLLVFSFVFVAGVFADLMETRQSLPVTAGVFGLLGAAALRNLLQLIFLR
jgi:mannose/fructose/N-acetylgalactosamine-specific phosphotransferase system component IIC